MRPDLRPLPPPPSAAELCADGTLTIAAAASFTGLSRRTIYNLVDAGQLSRIRVGRRVLIPKRQLVELLASGLQEIEP